MQKILKLSYFFLTLTFTSLSTTSLSSMAQETYPNGIGQPDFSIGSKLLDSTLNKLKFKPLFEADIFIGRKKLATYLFIISSDGLICPQRVMRDDGPFEFFSTGIQNAGCLDLQNFKKSQVSVTTFRSERNPVAAYLRGTKEEGGKEFVMSARSFGQNVVENGIQSVDIDLTISGKSHVSKIISAWVKGNTQISVRFETKKPGEWKISYLKPDQNQKAVWIPFNHLISNVPAPNFLERISTASDLLLTTNGSCEKPLTFIASKVEFKNESF